MHQKILEEMRRRIRVGNLRLPIHALNAMDDDGISTDDLIECVLKGRIVERQWDVRWGEWKYVIEGRTVDGREMEAVAKFGRQDDTIIITVYLVF